MLLDTEEAAEILEVTPAQVRSLIKQGTLPARKFGGAWVLERAQVVARTFLSTPPGRPLSAANAWEDIIDGTARTEDVGRYRNRGRSLRFSSRGGAVLVAADRLGGMISGMHAAQEYLEPISGYDVHIGVPMLGPHQDVYLPESAEPDLTEMCHGPNTYGRAVARLVPDCLWPKVSAASFRDSSCQRTEGVPLAPPLAAALDLWEISDGRGQSAAVSLEEWNKCLTTGTGFMEHAITCAQR